MAFPWLKSGEGPPNKGKPISSSVMRNIITGYIIKCRTYFSGPFLAGRCNFGLPIYFREQL